jgi:hypothetical protein
MARQRYKIAPAWPGFWNCGTTADGRQVMIYPVIDHVEALFFSAGGRFLQAETRDAVRHQPRSGPAWQAAQELKLAVSECFDRWLRELRFAQATITVEPTDDCPLKFAEWPEPYLQFLNNRESEPDDETRRAMQEFCEEWKREENFVMWFGDEFWMSGDGNIDST